MSELPMSGLTRVTLDVGDHDADRAAAWQPLHALPHGSCRLLQLGGQAPGAVVADVGQVQQQQDAGNAHQGADGGHLAQGRQRVWWGGVRGGSGVCVSKVWHGPRGRGGCANGGHLAEGRQGLLGQEGGGKRHNSGSFSKVHHGGQDQEWGRPLGAGSKGQHSTHHASAEGLVGHAGQAPQGDGGFHVTPAAPALHQIPLLQIPRDALAACTAGKGGGAGWSKGR